MAMDRVTLPAIEYIGNLFAGLDRIRNGLRQGLGEPTIMSVPTAAQRTGGARIQSSLGTWKPITFFRTSHSMTIGMDYQDDGFGATLTRPNG
jgi:hypothetical protein